MGAFPNPEPITYPAILRWLEHETSDERRRRRFRENGRRESFTLEEIGDRDGWICGICGGFIDRKYQAPEPRSPSIDHIRQVTYGGTDTRDNVRIAHLYCNMDRRDAPPRTVPKITIRKPNGGMFTIGGDLPARPARSPDEARARLARRIASRERNP